MNHSFYDSKLIELITKHLSLGALSTGRRLPPDYRKWRRENDILQLELPMMINFTGYGR